ncbi:DUF1810 domain-containing protein [Mucilaginibacter sp. KACC 22063]|uniref:DUF1810 domain-containing protein n=1 Tax=Mucilaginibacter sp. KACC 22063 TaxID=3025666 RepID=UPI0023668C6C|nr:DUF1810 domain-containing protein [Mucilaginibacter sp. KACC 22063]WDF54095.1 DUF1810 domain-containing protein [Mucilaginibacter sp. KACC 22063]
METLKRFLDAQKRDYDTALSEIKNGRKRSHWMWYIFPQLKGLGFSEASRYYGIKDLNEAEEYLRDTVLSERLIKICKALLQLPGNDAHQVFGTPDDMKLQSSMTLFSQVPGADPVFASVLDKYFGGDADEKTLRLLQQ